jgi:hypothetical protein
MSGARGRPEQGAIRIVTTMNDIPGYEIDEVYGEVFGLTVRSRNIGSCPAQRSSDPRRRAEGDDEGRSSTAAMK